MKTVEATAKVVFSRFVDGLGVVHGDPKGVPEAKKVNVPVNLVEKWAGEGLIAKPQSFKAPATGADAEADNPLAGTPRDAEMQQLRSEIGVLSKALEEAETELVEANKRADEAEKLLAEATKPDDAKSSESDNEEGNSSDGEGPAPA